MERMIPVVQTTLLDVTTEKPDRLTDEQFKALDELMLQHARHALSTLGGTVTLHSVRKDLDKARQAARRALTGDQS